MTRDEKCNLYFVVDAWSVGSQICMKLEKVVAKRVWQLHIMEEWSNENNGKAYISQRNIYMRRES